MINVQTSNAAAQFIYDTGSSTALGALGASIVSSPIGAAGGALFGFVEEVARIPLSVISKKLLNSDHPLASQSAKVLASVLDFFGRFAAAWGALHLAGMTMTLGEVAILVGGIYLSAIPLAFVLSILGLLPPRENERLQRLFE